MKPEDVKKLSAILARVGEKKFTAGALYPDFGNKTAVGHWLRKHQGAVVESVRLCAERDTHNSQWRYQFKAAIPGVDEMRDRAESETRYKTLKSPEWKSHENSKQLKKLDERAAQQQLPPARPSPGDEPVIVTPAPTPEYEYELRVGSDGKLTRTLLLNRDGTPREKQPTPAAQPAKSTPVKPATVATPWKPGCGRPFTKADAIAAHRQAGGTQSQELDMRPQGPLPEAMPGQSGPTGIRLPVGDGLRGGWRQVGPPNGDCHSWRQKL